jgi:Protein of unknown function (DUF3396)
MGAFQSTEITKGQRVAAVSQGVMLWFRGALNPHWDSLLRIWDWLVESRFWNGPVYARTSADMRCRRFDELGLAHVRREILQSQKEGPVWRFEIGNGEQFPDRSFEFSSLQATLGLERASYIRLRLPVGTSPRELLEAANRMCGSAQFHGGTAGYMFSFAESERPLAFDQIWAWARRYWGIEVIDVSAGSWEVLRGTYGPNWLTMVSDQMIDSKLPRVSLRSRLRPGVDIRPLHRGVMIQAGPRPLLGDMNRFEDVSVYAGASQLLEPVFLREPKDFPGMFTDHKSTAAWIRRFVEPDKWLEPEGV